MKNIKFSSNYGRFAYSITATVGEEVNDATEQLCLQGLANLGYRVAGSGCDKALEAAKMKGEKDKRGDVVFGPEATAVIQKAMDEKLKELAVKQPWVLALGVAFATTGEYVPAESSAGATKEAKEMWTSVQSLPAEKFAKALKSLGLSDEYSDEQGIAACHEKLKAAKAAAKLAAMNALEM